MANKDKMLYFDRLQARAWLRDGDSIHYDEALKLACLLHVRKGRSARQEEELKEIMEVF